MTETLELNIAGMTCANCVRHVTEALNHVEGVQVLEVGIGTAKLSVDPAHENAAFEAVREAGYEPTKA